MDSEPQLSSTDSSDLGESHGRTPPGTSSKLGGIIDQWARTNPRRNLKMLSRLTAIPYTSLRRITQNEVVPNLDQCLSILSYVASPEQRLQFIEGNFPEFAKLLQASGRMNGSAGIDMDDAGLDKFLDNPDYLELMELADSHRGLPKEYLREFFGSRGMENASRLIDDEVLMDDPAAATLRPMHKRRLNTSTLSSSIKKIKSFLDLLHRTRRAALYFKSESLREEAMLEVKNILNDAFNKVSRIMEDKRNWGDVPVGLAISFGRYHEQSGSSERPALQQEPD